MCESWQGTWANVLLGRRRILIYSNIERECMNLVVGFIFMIERISYDLEMKTREQNRKNKTTEIERFDWFIERIQTHLAFGWLSERSAAKNSCPKNFLEIALTSY